MIVLWLLLIASQFSVDYISQQYNYVKLKGKGYQKIARAVFEYANTRSYFKCYNYRENLKTIFQTTGTHGGTLRNVKRFEES